MDKPLVNRVANSSLKTIDLESFLPKEEIVEFDIKDYLFQGLILKEKDFRAELKAFDWSVLEGKQLLIYCSVDAIVPVWAYMLVSANARKYTDLIFFGSKKELNQTAIQKALDKIDGSIYKGERIIIKGCSEHDVPVSAYVELTSKLQPYAQSIMFGEACSNVPIFKRPRELKK